jgi:hypothetical protein
MNTFKRFGVGAVLLLTIGCTTLPTYDSNGNYRGSVPTWDAGRIANAGTCAIAGGLISTVLYGDPLSGAALGAGVCGAMPSYPQPIIIPQQQQYQQYQVVQPPPPYQQNYGYQYQPQQQYYPQQRICNTVDAGGWYTQYGQYMPNYQVVCQ